ncbi:MAG: NAD(P)-dependent oxidoreductase [Gammaproteobacteria bacterium]|nr:NAD(P)-dependent oxidoreductase [Gammaproteobacteria bacterium]NIU07017.1 NAD(P)-dependent oxidoreductase [Gammaproteobacteria bacterium]NIV53927.1 NAD-dependent epimerase/dehydratase family protein [Gammaproteobacteria bacterium]NIW86157.1 NAD-dependent epimerase/dehydratase family protein [Gammaproteobacteria bacterium]NIX88290.1 NAD-dependent epimerase/dehydratase family protein [Gammaproteobacteria bacterium]
MSKLLVTGAMGHVGFETVKQALGQSLDVVAQYNRTFRPEDAEALGNRVTWAQCDLSDPYQVGMLAAEHDIDGCIHPAAIPNDKMGLPQPLRTFQSNVAATDYLLETARRREWRRFVFVSTGAVYQEWKDKTKPIPETEPPTPRTLYGGTKRAAEIITEVYANMYGLSAASVRISWVFGPPLVPKTFEGPRGPIPEFLKRVLRGERVEEPSGGDFAASFTYVTDCALGLLEAYKADELRYTSYNLGSGENHSTLRVVDAIRAAVPEAEISVGSGPEPWTDYTVLRGPLSCERMKEDFGFSPTYTLESAVVEFADWMRHHPQSYAA